MARPVQLQRLRHGKLLCGGVFRHFVETWNWLVGAFDNMRGDADLNPKTGHVAIDRTDPDVPVIRIVNLDFGSVAADVSATGVFAPVYGGSDPEVVTGFTNCYYQIGGRTYGMGDQSLPTTDGVVAIRVSASGTSRSANIVGYASIADMQSAQSDPDSAIVPIYVMASSKIVCDMRAMPDFGMWEELS